MFTSSMRVFRLTLICVAVLAIGTGCATTAMKGTPLFTGEYQKPRGKPEDRVPLWPLLYYREPALSVLWPLVDWVDGEYFAARPFYNVSYARDGDTRSWSVLWPLIQQDNATGDGHALPFFWGDDYFVGAPLYWRFSRVHGVTDTLLPLWWYCRDREQSRLHALLGLVGRTNTDKSKGWYVFPIAGNFARPNGGYYRYQLLLAHQLSDPGRERHINLLAPLWLYERLGANRTLLTLLGGYSDSGDRFSWVFPPLLTGRMEGPGEQSTWVLWPLVHWEQRGDHRASHAIPFYYADKDTSGGRFFSIPWSQVSRKDGTGWEMAPPLYFHKDNGKEELTLTPVWMSGQAKGAESAWQMAFPFYFRQIHPRGDRMLTPIYSRGSSAADESRWSALFPLYYASRNADGALFATLLGGRRKGKDQASWMIYPLLTWNTRQGSTRDLWALAPLAHFHRSPSFGRSHIFPLYYWDGKSDTLLSPAYARIPGQHGTHTAIPPLLSWKSVRPEATDYWFLGGLARYSTGKTPDGSWLFPLAYRNGRTGATYTPLYCRWKDSQGETTFLPPLLSSVTVSEAQTRDLWIAAGLFHDERDRDGQLLSNHLLPFYAYAPGEYFYTPIAGKKTDGGETFRYFFTPLLGARRTQQESSAWLFPLYGQTRDRKNGDLRRRILWGTFNRSEKTSRSSLFPLFSYRNFGPHTESPPSQRYARSGKDFVCFPWIWRTDTRTSWLSRQKGQQRMISREEYSHGAFPLWSYRRTGNEKKETRRRGSLLLRLFDSYREEVPLASAPEGVNRYVRKRILWHVWHYEKLNGDVSVDIFPGIAYDRKQDGFKQVSFLWRFFRWQRDAEGKKKIDLLFIPLKREA